MTSGQDWRGFVGVDPGSPRCSSSCGNSGNSDAPHLHFQLMDANSPLGAEGFPYEIESFAQLGVSDNPAVLDSGQVWRPREAPTVHRRELPIDNAVVSFPGGHDEHGRGR